MRLSWRISLPAISRLKKPAEIIRDLGRELGGDGIEFFPGVSYRHLMVWRDGKEKMTTTPPHDITDQKIAGYMPEGDGAERLLQLMTRPSRYWQTIR